MKRNEEILTKLKQLEDKGLTAAEIATTLGISVATYYNWIKQIKELPERTKPIYEEAIFPDGEKAVMNYRAYKDRQILVLTRLDGSTTTLPYELYEYQELIHKYQNEMNETAFHFCEANIGRNVEPKYKAYMAKCKIYYSNSYQNSIKKIKRLFEQDELEIEPFKYHSYLYFNQFLNLSKKEIEEFKNLVYELFGSEKEQTKSSFNDYSKNIGVKQYGIYYHEFQGTGCLQKGSRPCVVISNNKGNMYSDIAIVAPITSKPKRPLPTHVTLELGMPSTILCEQLMTVNQKDLSKTNYELTEEDKTKLQEALMRSLGCDANHLHQSITGLLDLKKDLIHQKQELEKQYQELQIEIEKQKAELLKLKAQSTTRGRRYFE